MQNRELISRIIADTDAATLRRDLVKAIRWVGTDGRTAAVTDPHDIDDFFKNHTRFSAITEYVVVVDHSRVQREVEEEVMWLKEQVIRHFYADVKKLP